VRRKNVICSSVSLQGEKDPDWMSGDARIEGLRVWTVFDGWVAMAAAMAVDGWVCALENLTTDSPAVT
jgi:hypothetical protein